MYNPVVIKEYEEISRSEGSDKYKKDFADSNCDLDKLKKYLKCNDLTSALKITHNGVLANSYVGVIKFKNTHFQILPKLICDDTKNNEAILKNLIFMLSYTKNLQIKVSENSRLANCKNPFIEILIREFAQSLFECLKRLTPKRYVREEDNLNYLKGKIKFSENIRYNCANQAKFYCEFDEFSENNLLNQLFLFVSTCLFNISNDNQNKKLLKFIMNYYCDIKLVRFDRFKAEKIKLARNQELFKQPFKLAKMFIEKTSVDLSKNKFENISLVWDMNKLFEEFVYQLLKRNEKNFSIEKNDFEYTVAPQKPKKLLKNDGRSKRNTYVDIMLTLKTKEKKEQIVIDTKYKKFIDFNSISNGDIYQVSTYCLLHGADKAILLYPLWNEEPNITKNGYELNTDEKIQTKEIRFKTIDLKKDDLKSYVKSNDFAKILENLVKSSD